MPDVEKQYSTNERYNIEKRILAELRLFDEVSKPDYELTDAQIWSKYRNNGFDPAFVGRLGECLKLEEASEVRMRKIKTPKRNSEVFGAKWIPLSRQVRLSELLEAIKTNNRLAVTRHLNQLKIKDRLSHLGNIKSLNDEPTYRILLKNLTSDPSKI
jgi:hypothetical protein